VKKYTTNQLAQKFSTCDSSCESPQVPVVTSRDSLRLGTMERLVSGSSPLTFAGYLVKVLFNTFGPLCSLHLVH
jgi:hypothetical protein